MAQYSEGFRERAVQMMMAHKEKGEIVYIISAAPDIYVHAFCSQLQCDGYICSYLQYFDGRFTGKLDGEDCIGTVKADRLMELAQRDGIDLSRSTAYSDHEVDLPMLELVGNAVAVSPPKEFAKNARKRGWKIQVW